MMSLPLAPKNWILCEGQILEIQQYQDLFETIGTRYGGDGESTFALPDLRSQLPTGEPSSIHFIIASAGRSH